MTESTVDQSQSGEPEAPIPSFTYEAVPHAYVPSGRTTVLAVVLMVIAVAILSPIAGALMYGLDRVVGAILNFMYEMGALAGLLAMVVGLAAYAMGGFGIGTVLAKAVDVSGRFGKNRNVILAIGLAMAAGALTIFMFYRVRTNELDADAFNSFIDWLKLGLYAVGTLTGAASGGGDRVRAEPFCERCGKYVARRDLFSVPVSHEEQLHLLLQDGRFEDLVDVPIELDTNHSRSTVHLDYCLDCLATGYLSCSTELVHSSIDDNGNQTFHRKTQQIFSKPVDEAGISTLAGAYQQANRESPRPTPPAPGPQAVTPAAPVGYATSQPAPAMERSTEAIPCWTCDDRPADMTSIVPMTCPEGKGHAGRIDELRESGYLRNKEIYVPRCRECFKAETRLAWAAQFAAFGGIALGIVAGIAVGGPTESGWLGFFAGLATLVLVAVAVIWVARRSLLDGVNIRLPKDFPAVNVAIDSEWVLGSRAIPARGVDPRLLPPWTEDVPTAELV